jgi:hypothetical protein
MSRRSYKDALKSLSVRTGAPLSSLVISFGVLHEITAIVPLIGIFYGAKSLGVGESLVNSIVESDPSDSGVIRNQCRVWVHEGEAWAERVGRRYGIFGFPQTQKGTKFEYDQEVGGKIVGNVADAVLAYGATKVGFRPSSLHIILLTQTGSFACSTCIVLLSESGICEKDSGSNPSKHNAYLE